MELQLKLVFHYFNKKNMNNYDVSSCLIATKSAKEAHGELAPSNCSRLSYWDGSRLTARWRLLTGKAGGSPTTTK